MTNPSGAPGDGATDGTGVLFVVATPIGNLGDLTLRALATLRAADRIVAEDTRRTRGLLSHFGITGKPVDRLDAHATARDVERVVAQVARGQQIALVTDAGTPGVSDPGNALVRAAREASLRVVALPGASAVLTALAGCGLAGDGGFRFVGFLPRDGLARRSAIGLVASTPEAVVLFEAPGRVNATLRDLAEATPERPVCVARELTKVHEEWITATCGDLAASDRPWLGEVVIVLGPHAPEERLTRVDDAALDARVDDALARGDHARSIAERLAAWSGRPRREVYDRVLARKSARAR